MTGHTEGGQAATRSSVVLGGRNGVPLAAEPLMHLHPSSALATSYSYLPPQRAELQEDWAQASHSASDCNASEEHMLCQVCTQASTCPLPPCLGQLFGPVRHECQVVVCIREDVLKTMWNDAAWYVTGPQRMVAIIISEVKHLMYLSKQCLSKTKFWTGSMHTSNRCKFLTLLYESDHFSVDKNRGPLPFITCEETKSPRDPPMS